MSITLRNTFISVSTTVPRWLIPALLYRISILPKQFHALSAKSSNLSSCEMSKGRAMASAAPNSLHRPTTLSNRPSSKAVSSSRAPSWAKRYAVASPIPDEAPVIQTTLLSNRLFTVYKFFIPLRPLTALAGVEKHLVTIVDTTLAQRLKESRIANHRCRTHQHSLLL